MYKWIFNLSILFIKISNKNLKGEILEFEAKKGETILITGPASIHLIRGSASTLGYKLYEGRRIVVFKEKQVTINVEENSCFSLNKGESASNKVIKGDTFPDSWKRIIEELIKKGQKKIFFS